MNTALQTEILRRIELAMEAAREVFARFTPGKIETEYKVGHDPVTEADRAVDAVLKKRGVVAHRGRLAVEESADHLSRLENDCVWVVDPLDGTREFVKGIPEFCVSVAFVQNRQPIAGGICNPVTNEVFLGSLDTGLQYNGRPAQPSARTSLQGATILASRSEVKRGEWKSFEDAPFQVRAMGSVAYKLALVSAGLADATFTLTPKNEWDVAGGSALVQSAGGFVQGRDTIAVQSQKSTDLGPDCMCTWHPPGTNRAASAFLYSVLIKQPQPPRYPTVGFG